MAGIRPADTTGVDLPFTREQFLDVFGAYNAEWWPVVLALWLISIVLGLAAIRRPRPPHRAIVALMAISWIWSGVAYHGTWFATINPAARIFAVLFVVEGFALLWAGVVNDRLRVRSASRAWRVAGAVLVIYALAYPVIGLLDGLTLPRMPAFGVPCPTTILTVGLLVSARPVGWMPALVPVLWCGIGGSAAVLLGMHADAALVPAGVVLVAAVLQSRFSSGPLRASAHGVPPHA